MKMLYGAHTPFVVLFLLFVAGFVAANWTSRRRTP
jgi:hypothetical protein